MITASLQPGLDALTAILTRQAEAMAEQAAGQTRDHEDSTAIWRDARRLWPLFTQQAQG